MTWTRRSCRFAADNRRNRPGLAPAAPIRPRLLSTLGDGPHTRERPSRHTCRWRRSVSIGSSLAEARHQSGLTVTQVSRRTRIRESIIRDIEADDFSACGGDFYARGHIRSIATAIGFESQPLISAYDADRGPLGEMRAADVFEPTSPIKIRERRSPGLSLIVAVVLLVIIGFSVDRLVSDLKSVVVVTNV